MQAEAKLKQVQFWLWTLLALVVIAACGFAYLRIGSAWLLAFLLAAIIGRLITKRFGPRFPAVGFLGAVLLSFLAVLCYYFSIGVYYSRDILFFLREWGVSGVVSNCFLTAMLVSLVAEALAWFVVGPRGRKGPTLVHVAHEHPWPNEAAAAFSDRERDFLGDSQIMPSDTFAHRHSIGISRRELLQVGYSGLLRVGLSSVLARKTHAARANPIDARALQRPKSIVLVFLTGAASHHDTFDMKPDAYSPDDVGATVYRLLGIPAEAEVHDRLNRPVRLNRGQVIEPLFSGAAV